MRGVSSIVSWAAGDCRLMNRLDLVALCTATDFNKVVPTLKKSDDFGESQTTFEISGRISVRLSENVKSCLSFCKVGRKLKKPAGNSESWLEISISV